MSLLGARWLLFSLERHLSSASSGLALTHSIAKHWWSGDRTGCFSAGQHRITLHSTEWNGTVQNNTHTQDPYEPHRRVKVRLWEYIVLRYPVQGPCTTPPLYKLWMAVQESAGHGMCTLATVIRGQTLVQDKAGQGKVCI